MPYDSSHMDASSRELELSRVCCLLEELDGKKKINAEHWAGYHPLVYNQVITTGEADKMVRDLCSRLQKVRVKRFSLDMQIWWRDHQAADQARQRRDRNVAKIRMEREKAYAKLTQRERQLLGLK